MQPNPIVVDGVLYATTPKLRVIALDAATGREIWTFDPNTIDPKTGRFRHRGVTVYRDRVFVTHRNNLWALDKKTGKPIPTFGDSGRVDLRKGLDRPFESQSVSASTPGVMFEELLHHRQHGEREPAVVARRHSRVRRDDRARSSGSSTRFRGPASSATTRGRRTRTRSPAARTRGPA